MRRALAVLGWWLVALASLALLIWAADVGLDKDCRADQARGVWKGEC